MRVAIVHDKLCEPGGAEFILKILMKIFPSADIYTLFYDRTQYPFLKERRVITSFLDVICKVPLLKSRYRLLFPFVYWAFSSFDLSAYDAVINISFIGGHTAGEKALSSDVAKQSNMRRVLGSVDGFAVGKKSDAGLQIHTNGGIPNRKPLKIVYFQTPPRHLWIEQDRYLSSVPGIFLPIAKKVWNYLKAKDLNVAPSLWYVLANSTEVKKRVEKVYGIDNVQVLYPPVEVRKIIKARQVRRVKKGDFYLILSRLMEYKRFDIAVSAFASLRVKRLIVAGTGPELAKLKRIASGAKNIEFLGRVDEATKLDLLARAKALILPGREDFGIVMAEALAAGTPVIGYYKGGAAEILTGRQANVAEPGLQPGGVLIEDQTVKGIVSAIKLIEKQRWPVRKLQALVEKYDVSNFVEKFKDEVFKGLAPES